MLLNIVMPCGSHKQLPSKASIPSPLGGRRGQTLVTTTSRCAEISSIFKRLLELAKTQRRHVP